MKTRLDVLKQHAETTKVLKFQGWMRELIAMLEAAEAYRPVSVALMRDNIALKATITAREAEITELHNDVGFCRCCALSGEIPVDSVKPSALLKQEQE